MYAARINGGSVENEFPVAANNKEKEREEEKEGRQRLFVSRRGYSLVSS